MFYEARLSAFCQTVVSGILLFHHFNSSLVDEKSRSLPKGYLDIVERIC
jgi:hypothetical protein